jgi:hypothetical protein
MLDRATTFIKDEVNDDSELSMSHAPSPIRYSENIAKIGLYIGASSVSGITLDNSVEGLTLSCIDDKGIICDN